MVVAGCDKPGRSAGAVADRLTAAAGGAGWLTVPQPGSVHQHQQRRKCGTVLANFDG